MKIIIRSIWILCFMGSSMMMAMDQPGEQNTPYSDSDISASRCMICYDEVFKD